MKTMTIMLVVLLALGLVAPMIAAADEAIVSDGSDVTEDVAVEELVVEDAGITPDSPLHGLDKAMERLRLAVTFGKANKAELKLKYAEERLSEAEQMVEEGNDAAAAEAEKEYNEEISETEELVEEIEADGDEDTAEEALETVSELRLKMLSHSEKVATVKSRILDRMRAGNASDEKIAHLEEVFGRIELKAQEMEQKAEEKRTRVRTAYKVLSEKNESELSEKEADFLARVEKSLENREEIKAKIKAKIKVGDDEEETEIEVEFEDESDDDDDELEVEVEIESDDDSEEDETQGAQEGRS